MPNGSDGPHLVVGLGNPGAQYAGNRHNAGFVVLDELAHRMGRSFRSHKARADVADGRLDERRVVLGKPRSFMNTSGGPVAGLAAYFGIPIEQLIVVHDELDIPFGDVRLKAGGGDNGHNGLRSLSSSLGSRDYVRVRVGIGRPPGRQDPADFVLQDFSAVQRRELPFIVDRAADAVQALIADGLDDARNRFHAPLPG